MLFVCSRKLVNTRNTSGLEKSLQEKEPRELIYVAHVSIIFHTKTVSDTPFPFPNFTMKAQFLSSSQTAPHDPSFLLFQGI